MEHKQSVKIPLERNAGGSHTGPFIHRSSFTRQQVRAYAWIVESEKRLLQAVHQAESIKLSLSTSLRWIADLNLSPFSHSSNIVFFASAFRIYSTDLRLLQPHIQVDQTLCRGKRGSFFVNKSKEKRNREEDGCFFLR